MKALRTRWARRLGSCLSATRPTTSRSRASQSLNVARNFGLSTCRRQELQTQPVAEVDLRLQGSNTEPSLSHLPWSCPGCGAYTQQQDPNAAGFFSTSRKAVKAFTSARETKAPSKEKTDENAPDGEVKAAIDAAPAPAPVCDRCHDLQHHRKGVSVEHPTLPAIQNIFEESPYNYNHVYHVIDAADFPMSLVPRLQDWLDISPQRSQNRRSHHSKYHRGRKSEMSFIITRSDLLAPKKEQVDNLMPTMVRILRNALGRTGQQIRLGNVSLVSAHRGWWTKELKSRIWDRGGGGWMVGKVNVGKSNLLQNILPKGPAEIQDLLKTRSAEKLARSLEISSERGRTADWSEDHLASDDLADLTTPGLLPPRPRETDYPVLPTISRLPGTTASPIRIPFGKNKGELIDLPGLNRSGLDDTVQDEYKAHLVMESRVKPSQLVIQPGQSLVISNLIRITPQDPNVTFLMAPFLPRHLECHVCHTDKAKEILAQTRNHVLKGIAKPDTAATIQQAGTYQLHCDITAKRAGPLTARDGVGLAPEALHFVVFGLDLLIEGVGWIEISAQVRRKDFETAARDSEPGATGIYPEVEVFSPDGKHIGQRDTINAWLLGGEQKPPKSRRRAPQRSMKGHKKAAKLAVRQERARQRAADLV